MTKEELEQFKEQYDRVKDLACSEIEEYLKLHGESSRGLDELEFNVEDGYFEFSGSVPCGRGCCSDYVCYELPFEFIYNKERFIDEYKRKKELEAQHEAEKKRLAKEAADNLARKKRQETYERLKKEFDDN